MQTATPNLDLISTLAYIAGLPILFGLLLAGMPVLIPLLAYRLLSRAAKSAPDVVAVAPAA